MMGKRYIKLYEQILNWEWYKSPNTFRVFIHCLLTANYADSKFEGIEIKRGQLVTSIQSLAKQTLLSPQQVRTSLDHLILTGEITSKAYSKYRVITIVKYNDYQQDNKEVNKQSTSNQQASNKQSTSNQQHNKNTIKEKEEVEEYNNPPTGVPLRADDQFYVFWTEYPRHDGKMNAKKAFDKLKPDGELMDKILEAIRKQKESLQWQKDGGQFIPYPATWLNGRRWEDEVAVGNGSVTRPKYPDHKQTAVDIHGYSQRDYSNEQAAAIARMMNDTWGDE